MPLVLPAVLLKYQILLLALCPLSYWGSIPAELPGWPGSAAIFRCDTPNDRKVPAAISETMYWSILCDTIMQSKVYQITNAVGIQNRPTGIFTHQAEAYRDWFEA